MAYTKEIGLRDYYNYYKENAIRKGKEYKDYKTFVTIIKEFNTELRHKIVYESEKVKLPRFIGYICIKKFHNTYTQANKKNWKVDFKATKEQGHVVYHGSEYGYRWKWYKTKCRIPNRKWYGFKPCRTASRLIADAIKNKNVDYYEDIEKW